mmetsp:Transcript_86520/g.270708  ORF Transcript_86520/g.270708 Transcript_86520/m.270708 type:complete len:231 (+) Transcript_86520:138-830(+)
MSSSQAQKTPQHVPSSSSSSSRSAFAGPCRDRLNSPRQRSRVLQQLGLSASSRCSCSMRWALPLRAFRQSCSASRTVCAMRPRWTSRLLSRKWCSVSLSATKRYLCSVPLSRLVSIRRCPPSWLQEALFLRRSRQRMRRWTRVSRCGQMSAFSARCFSTVFRKSAQTAKIQNPRWKRIGSSTRSASTVQCFTSSSKKWPDSSWRMSNTSRAVTVTVNARRFMASSLSKQR